MSVDAAADLVRDNSLIVWTYCKPTHPVLLLCGYYIKLSFDMFKHTHILSQDDPGKGSYFSFNCTYLFQYAKFPLQSK